MSEATIKDQFPNVLPASRLGQSHRSLEAYTAATNNFVASKTKQYSLVMVTEPETKRILLGLKHRGFGKGMNNSFGGKLEPGETDLQSAVRELEEEAGIQAPASAFRKVARHHFSFEDTDTLMLVHVYRLDVCCTKNGDASAENKKYFQLDPDSIRGCDEITPLWVDDWRQVPLHNMFADDSLWLTRILTSPQPLFVEGYFHFLPGGQEVNSIEHHFMDIRGKLSLERSLFHELHRNEVSSPSIKEFKEGYAFASATKTLFGKGAFDVVLDVAGGHGALAALFLVTTTAQQAVVIDPANVGNGSVQRAWGHYLKEKVLEYRYECLRTALPSEILRCLEQGIPRERILVVACHACQHLSDETLQIACAEYGVAAAVMPCCQKDTVGSWKSNSKNMGLPIAVVMDLLLAGKAMSWDLSYDVRMKTIDAKITPQNRIILCRPTSGFEITEKVEKAHARMKLAYRKAHENAKQPHSLLRRVDVTSLSIGLTLGAIITLAISKR